MIDKFGIDFTMCGIDLAADYGGSDQKRGRSLLAEHK